MKIFSAHTSNLSTAGAMAVDVNSGRAFTINGFGNVGIGTASPANGLLNIQGTSNQISLDTGTAGDGRLHIGHFSNGTFIGTYGDDGGAADVLRFGTHSGDERMRIDSSGNVGIGTTNPSAKLEVTGATLVSDDGAHDFVKQSVSGTTSTLSFGNTESTGGIAKWQYNRATGSLSGFVGTAAATEFMTINSSGNIGIGATSPATLLELSANGTCNFRMSDSSSPATFAQFVSSNGVLQIKTDAGNAQANSSMQFFVDTDETMRIDSSGNLLVNTTSEVPWTNSAGSTADNAIAIRNDGLLGVQRILPIRPTLTSQVIEAHVARFMSV